MRIALFAFSVLLFSGMPASAEDEAPPKAYTDLLACRSIEDSAARLACFDSSSAEFEKARITKEVVLLDRRAVRKTRRSLFGFSLPDLPFFDGDDSAEEEQLKEITATIESVRELGLGKWQFAIPDGGTWQTTEALTTYLRDGLNVTIKKGVAGGYMMKVGNGPLRRVKRVD